MIAFATVVAGAFGAVPVPTGVFSLSRAGVPADDAVFLNPDVAGVSLRQSWIKIEAVQGQYDWSYFDGEIARAKSAGKKVLLRVMAGGINTPSWVFSAGVQTFTFVNSNPDDTTYGYKMTIPVFWDPILLAKRKNLIVAMGAHFANNPTVVLVSSSGANSITDDWNVPQTDADIKNWKAIGYTSAKLTTACQQEVDATMAAFPTQTVLMAVSQNGLLDATPDTVARAVVSYARGKYGARFVLQKNNLAAVTKDPMLTPPPQLGPWRIMADNVPQGAGQMLWYVTGDSTGRMNGNGLPFDPATTLRRAVQIGLYHRLNYEEIYEQDIVNPDLASVVHYAASNLTVPPGITATAVWSLNGSAYVSGTAAPTLPSGWLLRGIADFDGDGQLDYAIYNPTTQQTAIWYVKGTTFVSAANGPVITSGYELVACADFNKDGKPDFVLWNKITRQTMIWLMNNALLVRSDKGPTLPTGFKIACAVDFNGDGFPDYVLCNVNTYQTSFWYMNGTAFLSSAAGPKLDGPLLGAADFNGDKKPDFIVLNKATWETSIRYMNGVVVTGKIVGPTLPRQSVFAGALDFDANGKVDYVIADTF